MLKSNGTVRKFLSIRLAYYPIMRVVLLIFARDAENIVNVAFHLREIYFKLFEHHVISDIHYDNADIGYLCHFKHVLNGLTFSQPISGDEKNALRVLFDDLLELKNDEGMLLNYCFREQAIFETEQEAKSYIRASIKYTGFRGGSKATNN